MRLLKRLPVAALAAGLAVLAGCTAASAASGSAAGQPDVMPARSPACQQAGTYLTAIRTGEQAGFDRVVFQFSGKLPAHDVAVVKAVYSDPKGDKVPLAGQAFLEVVFHGATALCPPTASKTYAGPSTLAPFYPRLLEVRATGDFEQVLGFGVSLAAPGSYRVFTLAGPNRVVLDVSHVALRAFPGIWHITSWRPYWESQYSWLNGHQPWLSNPALVVQAWARGRWHARPVVHQVNASTFHVTEPGGRIDTVTGTRPVPVPGPWVITKISYGTSHA